MIGAIIGDIVGSRFEFNNYLKKDFNLMHPDSFFTDDTVCTIAVADWLMKSSDYGVTSSGRFADILQKWCGMYPYLSYGSSFVNWIKNKKPYNSFGNGAAMRISPVGLCCVDESDLFSTSDMATRVSHNHPEGMKGARAVALAVFLAKYGASKSEIKSRIVSDFGYDLNLTCASIRKSNKFDETCQVTVPQSLVCFFESTDFVDAIRLAVSIGGDSDTIATIVGSVAEAFYQEIPEQLVDFALSKLPSGMVDVVLRFPDYLQIKSLPSSKIRL